MWHVTTLTLRSNGPILKLNMYACLVLQLLYHFMLLLFSVGVVVGYSIFNRVCHRLLQRVQRGTQFHPQVFLWLPGQKRPCGARENETREVPLSDWAFGSGEHRRYCSGGSQSTLMCQQCTSEWIVQIQFIRSFIPFPRSVLVQLFVFVFKTFVLFLSHLIVVSYYCAVCFLSVVLFLVVLVRSGSLVLCV